MKLSFSTKGTELHINFFTVRQKFFKILVFADNLPPQRIYE